MKNLGHYIDDSQIKYSLDFISNDKIVVPKSFDDQQIVQEDFYHISNHETIGDVFQINSVEYHLDSYASHPIYDMYQDDLEQQFFELTRVEISNSK